MFFVASYWNFVLQRSFCDRYKISTTSRFHWNSSSVEVYDIQHIQQETQDVTGCDRMPGALPCEDALGIHWHVAQKCLEVSPESQWSSDSPGGHCCSLHIPTSRANTFQLIWKQSDTFRLASPVPSNQNRSFIVIGSLCQLIDVFKCNSSIKRKPQKKQV